MIYYTIFKCVRIFHCGSINDIYIVRPTQSRTKEFYRFLYGSIFLFVGKIGLLMYYLDRIKEAFSKSAFGISTKCYNISKISLLVSTIIYAIFAEMSYVLGNETGLFYLSKTYFASQYIVGVLLDIFWGTFLTILFLNRMYKIIKLNKDMTNNDSPDDNLVKIGYLFKYAAFKLTLLYIIAYTTTILLLILTMIRQLLYSFIMIDCFINSLCLILSFNFFDKSYKKLCYPFRMCCEPKK